MKLFTKEIEEKLKKAGYYGTRPICKLFTPWGKCTWLITGISDSYLVGYCDLGMGCVEFGQFATIEEIESIKGPFGLKIERDLYFKDDGVRDYNVLDSLVSV